MPRIFSCSNRGKNHKGVPRLLPQQLLKDLNHMLNTSIKDTPDFIRILISSIKKSYLKITLELLSTKLCDSPRDFIFSMYYYQAIDLTGSKTYISLNPMSKRKPSQIVYSIYFENKGVELINIARISSDPDIVKSLLSSSVKSHMPMVTYKPTYIF